MAFRRVRLILQRWVWLLLIAVGCAALVSWVYVTQMRPQYNPWLVVLLVTLGGLAWGLAGIFGIEYLRDHVKTPDDVRRITSAPILATVAIDLRHGSASPFEDSPGDSSDPYRTIAAQLMSGTRGQDAGQVILICASQAAPQTARVAANVAAAAARLGYSTMLVDANRHEPDLTKSLDLGGVPGFADALLRPG